MSDAVAEFCEMVELKMEVGQMDRAAAVRAVAKMRPEAHKAYLTETNRRAAERRRPTR
ncbi:MAG TPA: hypothetical protein VGM98_15755 [Schlesneria sp.]|jgi:hypothetical protein